MPLFFKVAKILSNKNVKNYLMDRIAKLKDYMKTAGKDSFLQHALALEYIKIKDDEEARKLFNEILKREPTYIGSYYHLGKLLERINDPQKALRVYQRGMEIATAANDHHSYTELQAAFEDLEDIQQ
ncbi:MAG: tetratricopeptide repeat protein [Ginsengibacter sp.]